MPQTGVKCYYCGLALCTAVKYSAQLKTRYHRYLIMCPYWRGLTIEGTSKSGRIKRVALMRFSRPNNMCNAFFSFQM